MNDPLPICIHCHVTADKEVIPDAGFEADAEMEDQGYRGKANFQVLAGRKTEPPYVVCHAVIPPESTAEIEMNPPINFCWFDYSYWSASGAAWVDASQAIVFGLTGPADPPSNTYHIDETGSVDSVAFGQFLKTLGFTMKTTVGVSPGFKLTKMYFYRWRGWPGLPSRYPYGISNRPVLGVVTVTMDIWKRTYPDTGGVQQPPDPGTWGAPVDVFHETKSYVVDLESVSVPAGIPAALSFSGFTGAQINTFAQATIADSWPQTEYASGDLKDTFFVKSATFTVVPP